MFKVKKWKVSRAVAMLLCLALTATCFGACGEAESPQSGEGPKKSKAAFEYSEEDVKFTPQVPEYQVADDFSNVIDIERYELTDGLMQMLKANYFAVTDAPMYDNFFEIYEQNRYELIPSFITVDSVLNGFHSQFDFILKSAEKKKLYDDLVEMTRLLLESSRKDYENLKGTVWENAAKRNLAYVTVAASLLNLPARSDIKIEYNEDVASFVKLETEKIYGASGIAQSPVMNIGEPQEAFLEDYSQYAPRGHYANEDELKLQSYFRAMMWYGRIAFRLEELDEVKSSILLAYALSRKDINSKWESIYDVSSFFAGQSDSLSPIDYYEEISKTAGKSLEYGALTKLKKADIKKFAKTMYKKSDSKINTMPIYEPSIQPDRKAATAGCRLMGQRYSLDAEVFANLVYRAVGENDKGWRRMLPKVLDVPAAFGSKKAIELLKDEGDFEYADYEKNLTKMQQKIAAIDKKDWHSDLYQAWLYNLIPLTKEDSLENGYPKFMRNTAWLFKNLNAFIGSYTELKHDTVLYSAQMMAEMGGAGEDPDFDDRGYVEPAPVVYERLRAMSDMLSSGLKEKGLLSKTAEKNLAILSEMCKKLKGISIKELENKQLTEKEFDFISEFGGNLEHIWFETFPKDVRSASLSYENPAMLVTDIASSPEEALSEATGAIRKIWVLVPMGDKLQLAQGAIFRNHEFTVPLSQRLTDREWIELVRSDQYKTIPDHEWIKEFYVPEN